MATAIYMRVSTTKQEDKGVSLETQKNKLHAYCEFKGLTNVKEYLDVGSARNTDRESFKLMVRDVKKGNIKNIVVFKLDRLNRSISDLNNLIQMIEEHGCGLHSATENLDTSSANGRLMVNLIGVIAQWESETISERVVVNMETLASQGVWQSKAPYGFLTGEDRRLEVYEEEAQYLRIAFDLIYKGESASNATRIVNEKYGLGWTMEFLRTKIYSHSLIGNIYRNGVIYENTHQGIITKKEQRKLIDIIQSKRRTNLGIKHIDLFRRKLNCPQCDKTLSALLNNKHYYYQCNHCRDYGDKQITAAETMLEKALIEYIGNPSIENFSAGKETPRINVTKQLEDIKSKRDKIQRAWINDLMSDDDLIKYKKELDDQEKNLLNELDDEHEKPNLDIKDFSKKFNELYYELTQEEKRQFIQMHVKRIYFTRTPQSNKRYKYKVDNVEFY